MHVGRQNTGSLKLEIGCWYFVLKGLLEVQNPEAIVFLVNPYY